MFSSFISQRLKRNKKHEQVLRSLTISESGPGTILHDFGVILTMVREGKLSLTPKKQLTGPSAAAVNKRLIHPIQLDLHRPIQKSYLSVAGLYLLLRASGLASVGGTAAKPILKIDEKQYQHWINLNPTEQYAVLLESWFIRGTPDIIGEPTRLMNFIPHNFDEATMFYTTIPATGMDVAGDRRSREQLDYTGNRFNVALLWLFGLIELQDVPPQSGKGWNISKIDRTPLGDALLTILHYDFFDNLYLRVMAGDLEIPIYGAMQPLLQAYWPDFKGNLIAEPQKYREGRYVFKVALGDIWRRIAIGSGAKLDRLAGIILTSVDFDNDHLYSFAFQDQFGRLFEVSHPQAQQPPSTSQVRVGDLPLAVGAQMVFTFDFGDNWGFLLTLEDIDPAQKPKQAAILETHGEAPQQYPDWDDEDEDFEDWDENEGE